jgi:ABC-2 type transport system ATP-binding protein
MTPATARPTSASTTSASTTAASTTAPLVFTNVSHWYGDVVAVNDISCTVGPGITGLLGPNGAGKSTLLQLAAGILTPSHGSVALYGAAPAGHPAVYREVALVPEREALPARLSACAFVAARAAMLGVVDVPTAVARALALVELDTVASRAIDTFSKGMKQRVKLAAALVHEPRVVLLDEPFNGLDPRQRAQMLTLLEARADAGTAILLSSHILEEIAGVASETLVLLSGRLAASGDYRTIRQLMTDQPHVVRLVTSDDRALAAALMQEPTVLGVELDGHALLVRTTDYAALARTVAPTAQRLGCTLFEVQVTDESLEHVFAYLVKR